MPRQVTAFSNTTVKRLRSLRDKKARREEGLFLAEGLRILAEARDSGRLPEILAFSAQGAAHPLAAEIIAAALAKYGRTDQLGREVSQRRVNQILAMSWYSHGYELYRARWFRKAAGSFWKAIKLDPSPLGAYKHLLMSGLSRWRDETPADGGR